MGDGYKWRLKPGCNEYDLTVYKIYSLHLKFNYSCFALSIVFLGNFFTVLMKISATVLIHLVDFRC